MLSKKSLLALGLAVGAMALPASKTWAADPTGATIISGNGNVVLGINNTGDLNDEGATIPSPHPGIGPLYALTLAKVGDALSPGCLCEGWGVSSGTAEGDVDETTGNNGIVVKSFSVGPTSTSFNSALKPAAGVPFVTSAVSDTTVTAIPNLEVIQNYTQFGKSGALFQDTVTIKNNGSTTLTDVKYARNMDWDIPPTEFNETISIQRGTAADLLHSTDNGFPAPNPLSPAPAIVSGTTDVNFNHDAIADQGSSFIFGFGDLAAGDSKTFSIFYGADYSESAALADIATTGAEVYALGEADTATTKLPLGQPGTYIFAFTGVGGGAILPPPPPPPAVPLPAAAWSGLSMLAALGLFSKFRSRMA